MPKVSYAWLRGKAVGQAQCKNGLLRSAKLHPVPAPRKLRKQLHAVTKKLRAMRAEAYAKLRVHKPKRKQHLIKPKRKNKLDDYDLSDSFIDDSFIPGEMNHQDSIKQMREFNAEMKALSDHRRNGPLPGLIALSGAAPAVAVNRPMVRRKPKT